MYTVIKVLWFTLYYSVMLKYEKFICQTKSSQ